ncbi:hypothetical protein R84B8_00726 [Treponema sp. R8-4-B8]
MKNKKSNLGSFAKTKLKDKISISLLIMILAVIGFSFAACGDGGGGDDPKTAKYTGTNGSKTYTLKITKAASTETTPAGTKNPFVGTWNGTDVDGDAITLVFTETGWTWSYAGGTNPATGTYTYSGSTATLSYDGVVIATGVITGSTLKVTGSESSIYTPWNLTKGRSVLNMGFDRAITPAAKDAYELTVGAKKSTGTVQSVSGNTLTLKPKDPAASAFDAAVDDNKLTKVIGLITFDDGSTEQGPGELTPSTPSTGGGGGGITKWTEATNHPFKDGGSINVIIYGNGTFVAGGDNGKMATSPDGKTWTAVADSKFGDVDIDAIAYGNNKFVAVGYDKTATSTDGKIWTAVPKSVFSGKFYKEIKAIAFGNGTFVAGGYNCYMATSTDGVVWTDVSDRKLGGSFDHIYSIAYGNGKWVAVGSVGIAYSTNGNNWEIVTPKPDLSVYGVAYGNNKFVAVGQYGTAYSTDGINNWTGGGISSGTASTFGSAAINGIAYGGNKFVIVGSTAEAKMAYSADGIKWTSINIGGIFGSGSFGSINAIVYGNGTFVAVGGKSIDGSMYSNWPGIIAYSTGN